MEIATVNQNRLRTPLIRWILLLAFFHAGFLYGDKAAMSQEEPRAKSRALSLPSRTGNNDSESARPKSLSSSASLWNTAISLGLIVGTLLVIGRWMKWKGIRSPQSLPIDAFEVLGQRTIDPKVTVHLVKCGTRILLLGVGAEGVRTLSEIDDPTEVEQLTAACHPSLKTEAQSHSNGDSPTSSKLKVPAVARRVFMAIIATGMALATGNPVQAQVDRTSPVVNRPREQADLRQGGNRHRGVQPAAFEQSPPLGIDPQQLVSPQQLGISIKMLAVMTIFSLAPSILMMTTSFVRFIVVLGLLRQALGTQQGPPNQVLTAICLFLTFLVMSPVWQRCYEEGIRPYTSPSASEPSIDEATALTRTLVPVREFMSRQIEKAGNADAIWMLLDFQRPADSPTSKNDWHEPQSYDEVPFTVLAPAYLLSELKVGFLIGFQLFLPFLVIDLVVSMILASLGLNMLPPAMVSLPMKLLLFVLIDGWFLTVGMLLESVRVV